MISRFSRPVSSSWMAADWPDRPISRRTAAASRTTSRPSTRARPPSGCSSVVRMRTAVVLPAPFGPSTPSTVPARHGQVDAAQRMHIPERLGQALHQDGRPCAVSVPLRPPCAGPRSRSPAVSRTYRQRAPDREPINRGPAAHPVAMTTAAARTHRSAHWVGTGAGGNASAADPERDRDALEVRVAASEKWLRSVASSARTGPAVRCANGDRPSTQIRWVSRP